MTVTVGHIPLLGAREGLAGSSAGPDSFLNSHSRHLEMSDGRGLGDWGYDMSLYPKLSDNDNATFAQQQQLQHQQQQEMVHHYYAAAAAQQQQVHASNYHQMQGAYVQQHSQPTHMLQAYPAAYQSVNADMMTAHGLMNGMSMNAGNMGMTMGMTMGMAMGSNPYVQQQMDLVNQQMAAAAAYPFAHNLPNPSRSVADVASQRGGSGVATGYEPAVGVAGSGEASSSYPVVGAVNPTPSEILPSTAAPNSSTKALLSLLKVGGSASSSAAPAKTRSNSLGPPPGLSPGPPPQLQDKEPRGLPPLPPSQSSVDSGYSYSSNSINNNNNNNGLSSSSSQNMFSDASAYSSIASSGGSHLMAGAVPMMAPSYMTNPDLQSVMQMQNAFGASHLYAAAQYSMAGHNMGRGAASLATLNYGDSYGGGDGRTVHKDCPQRQRSGSGGSAAAVARDRPPSEHRRDLSNSSRPSDFSITTDLNGSYNPSNLTIISWNKKKVFRSVCDQEGELEVALLLDSSSSRARVHRPAGDDPCAAVALHTGGLSIRPLAALRVTWTLPAEVFQALQGRELHVGLVRYGGLTNSPCIVSKSVQGGVDSAAHGVDSLGRRVVTGSVLISSPKSPGCFSFRLFDSTTKEAAQTTLATSVAFTIDLVESDVTLNLRFCLDSLRDNNFQRGLSQLALTVKTMRDLGRPVRGPTGTTTLLRQALDLIFSKLSNTRDRDRDNNYSGGYSDKDDYYGGVADKDDPVLQALFHSFKHKFMSKYFSDLLDLFTYINRSRLVLSVLLPEQEDLVRRYSTYYCCVLREFYADDASRDAARVGILGFSPCRGAVAAGAARRSSLGRVDKHLGEYMLSAMSGSCVHALNDDFVSARSAGVERVENVLCAFVVHNNVNNYNRTARGAATDKKRFELLLFGSAASGFCTTSSNVDLCLSRRNMDEIITAENKSDFLIEFGDFLAMQVDSKRRHASNAGGAAGSSSFYRDIVVSPNNATPFISFFDTVAKLTYCLHFHNPVYLHHSRLMAAYGGCDSRVKSLYALLAQWAGARGLVADSAAEGEGAGGGGDGSRANMNNTVSNRDQEELSCFSLLLLVVHFLQHRPRPLLPLLQTTAGDWDGLGAAERTAAAAAAAAAVREDAPEAEEGSGQSRAEDRFDDNSAAIMAEQWYLLRPADKTLCEAYFYDPHACPEPAEAAAAGAESARRQRLLQAYCAGNVESLAELLEAFFRYFCYEFDYFKNGKLLKQVNHTRLANLSSTRSGVREALQSPQAVQGRAERLADE